ncbi:hypothetical protein CR513_07881, partial [Mucuna pruriens]
MGRYEAHILGEVLPSLPDGCYPKRNLWNPAAYRENIARILGAVQSLVCNLSTSSDQVDVYDRSMIDTASRGTLMDKTRAVARQLIPNMASNTQQLGIKGAIINKAVNEVGIVDNLRMENQLIELTSLVCGIFTSVEHFTDMCPTLQETESDNAELVGAIGGNQYDR